VGSIVFAFSVTSMMSIALEESVTDLNVDKAVHLSHDMTAHHISAFLKEEVSRQKNSTATHPSPPVCVSSKEMSVDWARRQRLLRKQVLFTASTAPHLVQKKWGDLVPRRMRSRVLYSNISNKMRVIRSFQCMDRDCAAHFANYLRPFLLDKGEFLFKAHDVAMDMYFINKGTCEALDLAEHRVLVKIHAGER
jgi:hypothetical protein